VSILELETSPEECMDMKGGLGIPESLSRDARFGAVNRTEFSVLDIVPCIFSHISHFTVCKRYHSGKYHLIIRLRHDTGSHYKIVRQVKLQIIVCFCVLMSDKRIEYEYL
jgi:hypothetical protein